MRATSRPTLPVPMMPMVLALQRYVLHEGPASGLELDGLEGSALGGGEHEADDVLRYDGGGASGLIANDDAEFTGDIDVDHVDAYGASGDHSQAR